jgi:hypothetical protein
MKQHCPARILVAGIMVLALLCMPAMALSKEDILSQSRSPAGSPSIKSSIDQIIIPPSPVDTGTWSINPLDYGYPDCPSGDCIGEIIKFTRDDEPSGEEGRYICPPDRPVGKLHHTWSRCMSYRSVETGEVFHSECMNPETGQPYPLGTDDAGRTFIVHEDCPCAWADDYDGGDPPVCYDTLISRKPAYSDKSSLVTPKILNLLDTDIQSLKTKIGNLAFFPAGATCDSTIWC